jgi:hypothetical protein
MTKVELEMEANAFPFQAVVGLKDTMKFRLWHPGKNVEIRRERPIERKTTSDCFKYQIKSLEDAPHLKSARREPLGEKDKTPTIALSCSFAILAVKLEPATRSNDTRPD